MRFLLLLSMFLVFSSCQKKKKLLEGCWKSVPCYTVWGGSCKYYFNSDNSYGRFVDNNDHTYRLIGNKLRLDKKVTVKITTLNEEELIWEAELGSTRFERCD
jgi:hypothetical protein